MKNVKSLIGSSVATVVGKILLYVAMYNLLKGVYCTNEYLAIVLTFIAISAIKTFKIELEYK